MALPFVTVGLVVQPTNAVPKENGNGRKRNSETENKQGLDRRRGETCHFNEIAIKKILFRNMSITSLRINLLSFRAFFVKLVIMNTSRGITT